jgi:hypothetical protein
MYSAKRFFKRHNPYCIMFTEFMNLCQKKLALMSQYVWNIALYGAETWTILAVDQKHLESFEMWCWRRMEKISWTDICEK